VQYDPRQFHWLGSVAVRSYVGAVWHTVPYDKMDDVGDNELVFGGSGVADFYTGKTVTVVSPSGTGGSIYQYALLVSNHIGRHIPGQPSAVAEARNGGGGVKAANYVATAAPQDGLVIAELHPNSLLAPMLRKVQYDPRQFHWLGSVAVRSYVGAVWHTVPYDKMDDVGDNELVFGGSGVASYLTGKKVKVISGYKSGGATNLAMERGEVQGRGNYYEAFMVTNADWIADRKVKFLFRLGPDHPDLAGVDPVSKFAKTAEQKQMLKALESPLQVGQAFYVSGNVPPERVAALRKAFTDMLADPVFIADAKKQNIAVNPRTHEQVTAAVGEAFQTPQEVMDRLQDILKPK